MEVQKNGRRVRFARIDKNCRFSESGFVSLKKVTVWQTKEVCSRAAKIRPPGNAADCGTSTRFTSRRVEHERGSSGARLENASGRGVLASCASSRSGRYFVFPVGVVVGPLPTHHRRTHRRGRQPRVVQMRDAPTVARLFVDVAFAAFCRRRSPTPSRRSRRRDYLSSAFSDRSSSTCSRAAW